MTTAFNKLMDRLEDLLISSTAVPLTPWVLVNADKCLPVMDRLREGLPEEIRKAQQVLGQRDRILEEARSQALHLVEEAETRFEQLLSESELMRAVQQEAQQVRGQMVQELEALRKKTFEECEALKHAAYREAEQVQQQSEAYASVVLNELQQQVQALTVQLKEGQQQLKRLQQAHAMPKAPVKTVATPMNVANPLDELMGVSKPATKPHGMPQQTVVRGTAPAATTRQRHKGSPIKPSRKSPAFSDEESFYSL